MGTHVGHRSSQQTHCGSSKISIPRCTYSPAATECLERLRIVPQFLGKGQGRKHVEAMFFKLGGGFFCHQDDLVKKSLTRSY